MTRKHWDTFKWSGGGVGESLGSAHIHPVHRILRNISLAFFEFEEILDLRRCEMFFFSNKWLQNSSKFSIMCNYLKK